MRPVNTFKNKIDAFNWKNVNLLLASENMSIKDTRDKDAEIKQLKLVNHYLENIIFKD